MLYQNEILRGVRWAAFVFAMVLCGITARRVLHLSFANERTDVEPQSTDTATEAARPNWPRGPVIPPEPEPPHSSVHAGRANRLPLPGPVRVYPPEALVSHRGSGSQANTIADDSAAKRAPAVEADAIRDHETPESDLDQPKDIQEKRVDSAGRKVVNAIARFLHISGKKPVDSPAEQP